MTSTLTGTTRGDGAAPRPRPRPGQRPERRALTPRWLPWLLLAPALTVLGGLLIYPLGRVVVLSVQEFGLRELVSGESTWVGLDNFREVFGDSLLWRVALPNTVVFAAVTVALTVAVGTAIALLLARLGPWARWDWSTPRPPTGSPSGSRPTASPRSTSFTTAFRSSPSRCWQA